MTPLLEAARQQIRLRSDGALVKGLPSWVRVFGRIEVTPRGCWEFTGYRNEDGYGTVRHGGRMVGAHRVAWETANNATIPPNADVCHSCDNPPCVNPEHLFVGTHADNNADRHAKGRTVMPTNGPDFWRSKTHCPHGHPYSGDNVRYIATVHPGVGLLLADLLDHEGDMAARFYSDSLNSDEKFFSRELAVARAILGDTDAGGPA